MESRRGGDGVKGVIELTGRGHEWRGTGVGSTGGEGCPVQRGGQSGQEQEVSSREARGRGVESTGGAYLTELSTGARQAKSGPRSRPRALGRIR